MIYRDPNTLYKINNIVGRLDYSKIISDRILVGGHINIESIDIYDFNQVVLLDLSGRYITGVTINNSGDWSAEITERDIGNDNSCLEIRAFAANEANNYIYPLQLSSRALAAYTRFVKQRLPKNRKDVPSIKKKLRKLILKATQVPYVARSIQEAITTGNNYQTLELDDTLRRGGRSSREKYLNQIDFRGKTVLDIGSNTGENSRIARKLGATLVDGYEYDPYFVEIGRAINAVLGMTRVSLFQGDCTRDELFKGMKYDIVLALAVWVYIKNTIRKIAEITDSLIFETHTLDHGIEFYYQPILKYFPHAISLGMTEKPKNPHHSRMFIVFGKRKNVIENMVNRKFLKVKPYFKNNFITQYNNLSKSEVLKLARHCHEKHTGNKIYDSKEYVFGTNTYFELFLAGFHQFANMKIKIKNLVTDDNLYLKFLKEGIEYRQIDQNLINLQKNTDWMIRKISNKYEDAMNILDGHIDRIPPVELTPEPNGQLTFTSTEGEELRCEIFDGHHRFFICELIGAEKIHFNRNDINEDFITQRFSQCIEPTYTHNIR